MNVKKCKKFLNVPERKTEFERSKMLCKDKNWLRAKPIRYERDFGKQHGAKLALDLQLR